MTANPLASDLDHILEHTHDLWQELRGERVFVTGGTGFFGCWLLESFLWAQEQLALDVQAVVLTRDPGAFRVKAPHLALHPNVTLVTGDVRSYEFPPGAFSHFIHAATDANARLNEEKPLVMLDTIVQGTRHALDHAVACGANRFLLTSSGAVYGRQPSEMTHISEEYTGAPDASDPRSAYGEGKRLAELQCTLYARETALEPKIARCFAFIGPYLPLDAHYAIGNFIRDGLRGGPIVVQGDGTPHRSYLYAADLAIWLWTILIRGESCRPYNVGSSVEMTIAQVADLVSEAFPRSVKVIIRKAANAHQLPERYVPSATRAKMELGLIPSVEVSEAILRTARFSMARR